MKLFKSSEIKKFFKILYRLDRGYSIDPVKNIYKGYDKKYPEFSKCQQEVFVNRTINKWLKYKHLILYKTSEQTGVEYKQYISILTISLHLGVSGGELKIRYYDYSRPVDIFNELILDVNSILELEGEWTENLELHHLLLKITMISFPEKEYVFKAWDYGKYPKRKKKNQTADDIMKNIETTVSFKARTEKEAQRKRMKYQEEMENRDDSIGLFLIGDLIEIKEIT